ncbi:hypothetical protein L2E82_24775 [Cichorium intybus]|uniref:Uncharacterized protein n=1 Tax=Cichorium intybus TaxID=13427 RepID=A0ACB9E164_CICIN|nr:hypothetical protein L2E82_24775 [Cichorium intybus]
MWRRRNSLNDGEAKQEASASFLLDYALNTDHRFLLPLSMSSIGRSFAVLMTPLFRHVRQRQRGWRREKRLCRLLDEVRSAVDIECSSTLVLPSKSSATLSKGKKEYYENQFATLTGQMVRKFAGLPNQHFVYVKKIDPGLPLFLINYTDRTLFGMFEAASSGEMNIDPYAWNTDGSQRTPYPAQVQKDRYKFMILPTI